MSSPLDPPRPVELHVARTLHGTTVYDEFDWMLDVGSDRMKAHLSSEAAYANAKLRSLAPLATTIATEMRSRHVDAHSAPATPNGRWWYFTRRPDGRNHLQYWRSSGDPAGDALSEEQLLLDGNAIAEQLGGFSLGPFRVDRSHRRLAFGVDSIGDERFTLMFRDLESGELLSDRLVGTHYTCAWTGQGDEILYVTSNALNRPDRVWRHRLGTDQSEDVLVLEEPDPGVWLTVGSMRSGDVLFIRGATHTSTEVYLIDAHNQRACARLVRRREPGVYYEIDHRRGPRGGSLYVLHNANGPNFELAVAPFDQPSEWSTVLAHSDSQRLHWAMVFDKAVVVYARTEGRTGLIRLGYDGTGISRFFAEPGVTLSPASNPDYASTAFRYSYTSPIAPTSIRTFDLDTGAVKTIDTMTVGPAPDGRQYDPDEYISEGLWATSDDGTRIPITVVRRMDAPPDQARAYVLYAYGAYERTADMGFSPNRISLLDRGIGYAVAHVRGGGELGKRWHEDGRKTAKRNSILDYLACARLLIELGYARPGGIVGRSSSAGGLVVGAALNSAPELFAGITLNAPFVDPLASLLDTDRPLTVAEWEELGNPLADPAAFSLIRSYSPYENIREYEYPPVLALAGVEDARVSIAGPARWIARLRSHATGGPFVLLPEFHSGHRGPTGRSDRLTRDALVTAWIVDLVAQKGRAGG